MVGARRSAETDYVHHGLMAPVAMNRDYNNNNIGWGIKKVAALDAGLAIIVTYLLLYNIKSCWNFFI